MGALTSQVRTGGSGESSSDDSDDETANKPGKSAKGSNSGGVYVPPKLNPVHYDGDDTKADRARKQMERARKRALKYVLIAVSVTYIRLNDIFFGIILLMKIKFVFLRISSTSIIQDLKEECLDIPTEITEVTRAQQMITKAQKEKEEYEEAYLTRLPVTKAEKHRQRKLTTLGIFLIHLHQATTFCID